MQIWCVRSQLGNEEQAKAVRKKKTDDPREPVEHNYGDPGKDWQGGENKTGGLKMK